MTPRIRIPQDAHTRALTIRNGADRIYNLLTSTATPQGLASADVALDRLIDEAIALRPRLKALKAHAANNVESLG